MQQPKRNQGSLAALLAALAGCSQPRPVLKEVGPAAQCLEINVAPSTGLYVRAEGAQTLSRKLLSDADLDGVVVQVPWYRLQPLPDFYEWAELDERIAELRRRRKGVLLSVLAGVSTPPWVYRLGGQALHSIRTGSETHPCAEGSIPVPWDRTYLESFEQLITALGRRYNGNPYLTAVTITGINLDSEETALPTGRRRELGDGAIRCYAEDDVAKLRAAGYSRERLLLAWRRIVEVFPASFPSHHFSVVLSSESLPPFEDSLDPPPHQALFQAAQQLLKGRLLVQHNRLWTSPSEQWLVDASRHSAVGLGLARPLSSQPGGGAGLGEEVSARARVLRPLFLILPAEDFASPQLRRQLGGELYK